MKKPNVDQYTAKDEQVDRLLLIWKEVTQQTTSANTTITHVREKIERRAPTTIVNPGLTRPKSIYSREPPWEFTCLNHHTALRIAMGYSESDEFEQVKKTCYDFLSTEFTFHPTWDRSKRSMSQGWWDIDTSGIVCATLLDSYIGKVGKRVNLLIGCTMS